MNQYRPSGFSMLPPVIKNLLIINIICFIVSWLAQAYFGLDVANELGLHYISSPSFKPVQFVTYMFLHANFEHIFFNMFALWIFGNTLENFWGGKRFLIYYFVTGIGAGIIQILVAYIQLHTYAISDDMWNLVLTDGDELIRTSRNYIDDTLGSVNAIVNAPTVGASGAIFGLLMAFGMLFPNVEMYIMFIPIPIKAKWFVLGYGLIELFSGLRNAVGDNTAHFAHLGGMIFGYFLIKYWRKHGSSL